MSFSSTALSQYFGQSDQFYYFIADIRGKLIYLNPHLQRTIGHIPGNHKPLSIADIFIDAQDEYNEIVIKCLGNETSIAKAEFKLRSLENNDSCINWEISIFENEDGVRHTQGIGIAINRQNDHPEPHPELKHLANLVEVVSDIIISQDKDFKIISWNKAAEQVYGYTAEEMIGKKIREFLKFEFQGIARKEFFNILFTQGSWKGEAYVTNRYGRNITVLSTITKITNDKGELTGFVSISKDITERKKFEEQLMQQEIQKQKQLTQATIDGQEKERLEIGKELHDNISQHLTITRLYLEVIKEKKPEEIHEIINDAHKSLSSIINQIRHLSQSLVPPTLGDIGLVESVQEICDSLKKTHTFNIEFYHRHFDEEVLPDKLKLMLYRIIQEQVNNILRHAHADMITIRLESDAEHIILTVSDNGKGFDLSNYRKGLGLVNITNRAGLFNGSVDIETVPGKGCSLSVAIPCSSVGWHEMN